MKICTQCKEEKPLSEFYKNKHQLKHKVVFYPNSACKQCHRLRSLIYSKKDHVRAQRRIRDQTEAGRKKKREQFQKFIRSGKLYAYRKRRAAHDKTYALKVRLRDRLRHALRKKTKASTTMKLVGCTWNKAREWIESQFIDGMTWDNIHVDHMMPCAAFDLSIKENQIKCFHYTNLQPLFPNDNRVKSDQVVYDMKWMGNEWYIRNGNGLYRSRRIETLKT